MKRVQGGWNGWRRMSGVICDRRVPATVKGKVYKVAVRLANDRRAVDGATDEKTGGGEVAELKTREARLRWFGHVGLRRKDDGYIEKRMLTGKMKRGRPKRMYNNVYGCGERVMAVVEVTKEDADDRTKLRQKSLRGDP